METKRNKMRGSTVSSVAEEQIGPGQENVYYNQEGYGENPGRMFLVE